MLQGPYFSHDPISLTLCADLCRGTQNSALDAVWQLVLQDDGPIIIKSSFGLSVQNFQIYPVFMIDKVGWRKISDFLSPPQIRKLWPQSIQLKLNPKPECSVNYDLWVAGNDCIEGRIQVKNTGPVPAELGARVAAQLNSFEPKNSLNHTKRKHQTYLKGETENLQISLIMDGMNKPIISPELALENTKLLSPGESLSIFWRCKISKPGRLDDEERLFSVFPVNWDAEMARLELAQASRELSITTPHVDWDIALRMAQLQTQQLLSRTGPDSGKLTAIQTRNIHSKPLDMRIDKASTLHALSIWQLTQALLPANIQEATLLFESYLQDLPKPSLEKTQFELPFPILVQTAWSIHNYLQDKTFLEKIYPILRTQLFAWFWRQNDRDQDGMPEWFNLSQSALAGLSTFDLLNTKDLITPISTVESIGLCSLLIKECQALNLIAKLLEDFQAEKVLHTLLIKLNAGKKNMSNANLLNRDRDTHQSLYEQVFYMGEINKLPKKPISIETPSRLSFKIKPAIQLRKPDSLAIQGLDENSLPITEDLLPEDIQWLPGVFLYTSKNIFSRFDGLFGNLDEATHLCIYSPNINQADISHLIAWDPNAEIPALSVLVKNWLTEPEEDVKNTPEFGIPDSLHIENKTKSLYQQDSVNLTWNSLLLQHVLFLGEREMAFRLFSQLIQATIQGLKLEHTLFERYALDSGRPVGKANHIQGLLPINLFLDIMGVRIYSPQKVSVGGQNPFPWPVTVRFQGLEITRDKNNSTIIMPDGNKHHHFGSALKTFTMSEPEK